MIDTGFSYIGTKACGCCVAICADSPDLRKDTARTIAEWIKEGLTITRVPDAEAISRFHRCTHTKSEGA